MIHGTRIPISKITNKIPGQLFRSDLGYQHTVKKPTQGWYQLGIVRAPTKVRKHYLWKTPACLSFCLWCVCVRVLPDFSYQVFSLARCPKIWGLDLFSRFIPAVIPQANDSRYDVIGLDNETLHYTTDGIHLPDLVQILASDLSEDIRGLAASSTQSTTTSSTEESEDRNLQWKNRCFSSISTGIIISQY